MSNDQHVNEVSQALSSLEITTTRPQQTGKLALLPAEILLMITGEPGKDEDALPAKEFKALALSCSDLFDYARRMYYFADDCGVFKSALKHADLEAMKRCSELNALPGHHWRLVESCQCQAEMPHLSHEPLDALLECVEIGSVSMDKIVDALHWLLEKNYPIGEQMDQPICIPENEDVFACMPEYLIMLLNKSTDRIRTEGICQMVRLLQRYGYSLPFNMNAHTYFNVFFDLFALGREPGLIRKPMDVALRSHCPLQFLETVLIGYESNNVDVKVFHEECPEEMEEWAGYISMDNMYIFLERRWWQNTDLGPLIWDLFMDLMHQSTGWAEEYNGEIADVFEKKVNLLVGYQMVDMVEEQALRSVLGALRDIISLAESRGELDIEHDGKECWQMLVDSLRPWGTDEGLEGEADFSTIDDYTNDEEPHRIHRFVITDNWNPYATWYNYELQNPTTREKVNRPWFHKTVLTKKDDGVWEDTEWLEVLEEVQKELYISREIYRSYHGMESIEEEMESDEEDELQMKSIEELQRSLPTWYGSDYDEYFNLMEKRWVELEGGNHGLGTCQA
ncbi:hypothetical protein ACHAP5_007602 [Fusarium lateritium]